MENTSDLIVGGLVTIFGLLGLFLISGAADLEMTIFGLSLTGFAVCFVFGLIRRHYDRRDHALAMTQEHTNV